MKAYVCSIWRHVQTRASYAPYHIGANLFRIGAGLTILYQYLITYYQRFFLYGPEGVVPYEWFVQQQHQIGSFSLYALDASPLLFDSIYYLGIGITTMWVLGWQPRLMTFLTWVCFWSLHQRNPMVWDGGDNLMQIVLIYACFADLRSIWKLDADQAQPITDRGEAIQQALVLFHNTAVFAIAGQLCLVYGAAGIYKLQGELWQNGTALYYILRVGEFAWPGYGTLIAQQPILVTLLTYGTAGFQVSFPFLFFLRSSTRRLALVLGIAFHLGIGIVMGLTTFAAFMISIELLLIPDRDYIMLQSAMQTFWQQLRWWRQV